MHAKLRRLGWTSLLSHECVDLGGSTITPFADRASGLKDFVVVVVEVVLVASSSSSSRSSSRSSSSGSRCRCSLPILVVKVAFLSVMARGWSLTLVLIWSRHK